MAVPGTLEVPHPTVDDGKQTLNLAKLKAWAEASGESFADLYDRMGTAEGDIAALDSAVSAMPGSFAADSIDPSQVDVDVVSDLTYSTRNLINSTYVNLASLVVPGGIYVVNSVIQTNAAGSATVGDVYSFRLLVDLANTGTSYIRAEATTLIDQIVLSYIGPVTSAIVVQGNRYSGSGTSVVSQVVIRGARIG